jgi:hypothetical protein
MNGRYIRRCNFVSSSEALKILFSKILMRRDMPSHDTLPDGGRLKRGHRELLRRRLPNRHQLHSAVSTSPRCKTKKNKQKKSNRLTRRPHDPKSCSEFATSCIPAQRIVSISISSYSSVTVGRKKTSRPCGLSMWRAKRTRSRARWESS